MAFESNNNWSDFIGYLCELLKDRFSFNFRLCVFEKSTGVDFIDFKTTDYDLFLDFILDLTLYAVLIDFSCNAYDDLNLLEVRLYVN